MSFKGLEKEINIEKEKREDVNIYAVCKALIVGLIVSILGVWLISVLAPSVYFSPSEVGGVAGVLKDGSAGVTTAQVLSVAFMLLPLAFMAVFATSLLKNRKSRFNIAFVLPVVILQVFCFIMAVIQLAVGSGYQCVMYLIFQIFAMLTLMVFNLIENRSRLNLRGAMRKAGLVGVCIAIIVLSFTTVFKREESFKEDAPTVEITRK